MASFELDYTYDLLGRKLSGTDKSTSFEFASWLYDTLQIGQPTSSTTYVPNVTGGYTEAVTGYTSLGKPLGSKITLPASEAPLPTSYTTSYTYTANDQLLATQSDPAAAYLSSEKISYQRDALGNPTVTKSSAQTYVGNTTYTDYGEPLQVTYGASSNPASATYTYDDQTRDLTNVLISRTQAPGPTVDSTSYTYDAAGNLTSDTDAQSETGSTVTDQQCYSYDALDRLTSAWTANGSCATAPAAGSDLSTAAGSYWQSYSYDAIGDRTNETDYSTTTGTGSTTAYVNGCTSDCTPTGAQPHTLTSTTGGTSPSTFSYDADGNLATRTPTTGNGQKLTFNDEGELSEVDTLNSAGATTATTSYVYDASGNELIRRDPGQTTFFAGDTEIVVNTSVTPNVLLGAVRSYTSGGTGNPVAIRSSLGSTQVVDYEFTDPHGTATLEMDATTQQVARQEFTPYGAPRANANGTTWNDPTRGFLDKPQDTSTGYTDIGARKYDPTLGRFISDDPELETNDPQELGGYAYAADNPTTDSDPTGLIMVSEGGCVGSVQACERGDQTTTPGIPAGNPGPYYNNDTPITIPFESSEDDLPWDSASTWTKMKRAFEDNSIMSYLELGSNSYLRFGEGHTLASNLLNHYLGDSGTPYQINPAQMMADVIGFKDDVNLQVKIGSSHNGNFNSGWQEDSIANDENVYNQNTSATKGWWYSLNGYQYDVRGARSNIDGVESETVTVDVFKRYDWGNLAGGVPRGPVGGVRSEGVPGVPQNDIERLNLDGDAQDFNVWGQYSYTTPIGSE